MTRATQIVLTTLAVLPSLALAHPDHPHTLGFADSFGHLFSSPDHLLLLLLSVAAAAWCGSKLLRWLRDRQL